MKKHRDDEDFEALGPDFPAFAPMSKAMEEVDIDLSDLNLSSPDISRAKTRPLSKEELATNLEAAFGQVQITSRKAGEALSVHVSDMGS
jgi:hypothetical protein